MVNKLPYTYKEGVLLCCSSCGEEDEMDPEIEEAFEKFCMESEAKRKKWEPEMVMMTPHQTSWNVSERQNQERFCWFQLISQQELLGYNVTGFNGWDYGLVVMQHNWKVRQAIKLPLVWHLVCEVYFMRVLICQKSPQKVCSEILMWAEE